MRVLLRPVLVPELGLVIVKPGRESMPVFHNTRVLVEPEPKSMRNLPSGVVPAVRQPLVEDKTLLPFFSNARVIRAAGGAGGGKKIGFRQCSIGGLESRQRAFQRTVGAKFSGKRRLLI